MKFSLYNAKNEGEVWLSCILRQINAVNSLQEEPKQIEKQGPVVQN